MKTTTTTTATTAKAIDNEPKAQHDQIDPAKTYRYTWPGQEPKTCNGATLRLLLKGAAFEQLNVREVADESSDAKGDEKSGPPAAQVEVHVDEPAKASDKPTSPEVSKVGAK